MDKKIVTLLYRSFDTKLGVEDDRKLSEALSQSEALRIEKERIFSLREKIAHGKQGTFKPFFADRVLEKIHTAEQVPEDELFFNSLYQLFRPIAIAATVLIIIVAGYNISTTGIISLESVFGIPEISLDDVYDPTLSLALEE